MKKLHLIANAHLDPMWLWRWQEGCAEAISTFRTAEKFLKEFPDFVFNHNESLIYQWVKDYEPDLFERIQKAVAEGKWHIMGGWYLQPDCNLPNGESMIRNISIGRRFFDENFGKHPTTALNFDSFGHSVGLVQILAQAGYDSYVCTRASNSPEFEDNDFTWKGFNNTAVTVHRAPEGYSSGLGKAGMKISRYIEYKKEEPLCLYLWGVGDHGGGPSRVDLQEIERVMEENKDEVEIIHSNMEAFFEELRQVKQTLPVHEKSLNPVFEGCYTSQIRVKQRHRELENAIYSTEKMCTAAALLYGRKYPKESFQNAIKAMLFAEFHDGLPGSAIQPVEEDVLRALDYGLMLMDKEQLACALALTAGQEEIKEGSTCMFIYNPHPYPIEGHFAFEVCPPEIRDREKFYNPKVYVNGEEVPSQCEESFCGGFDWRKGISVQAKLNPSALNRVDVFFEALPERPERVQLHPFRPFEFDNGSMRVVINPRTGLVDSYQVNGKEYISGDGFALNAMEDTASCWELGSRSRAGKYPFALLTEFEGSEFSGIIGRTGPSVRVIEDGPVRTVVEALFGWHDSKAYQRYILPKSGSAFDVEVGVYWNERNRMLKLNIPTTLTEGSYSGQVMFGHEDLRTNGRETVAQKWTALAQDEDMLAVFNKGTYGSSVRNGTISLTLLRSAGYAGGDAGPRSDCYRELRHYRRMEQGERIFHFRIDAGNAADMVPVLDRNAQAYNETPYIFTLTPSGNGEKAGELITIDNPSILISAFKQAEDGRGYTLRLYEGAGEVSQAVVKIPSLGICERVTLNPFELRTYHLDEKTRTLTVADILD